MMRTNLKQLKWPFAVLAVAITAVFAAGAAPAWAASGNVTCPNNGTVSGSVSNVTVAAGTSCTLSNATASGNVQVQQGATLICQNSSMSGLQATNPAGIGISNCTVSHDLQINGLSGQGPGVGGDNYICASTVGHDLIVTNGATSAGRLVIGDLPDCASGNSVGHDLTVMGNGDSVDVGQNRAGHDVSVHNNAGGTSVDVNGAGHDAICTGNNPGATGYGNTAVHSNSCASGGSTCQTSFCFGASNDGTTDAFISAPGASSITIGFTTQLMPCSRPNTGDTVIFTATGATADKTVTYDVYGAAADQTNADGGSVCYGSLSPFTTASGQPAQLGPGGLYYGLLQQCTFEGEGPPNVPCVQNSYYLPSGECGDAEVSSPPGSGGAGCPSQYTDVIDTSPGDPQAGHG